MGKEIEQRFKKYYGMEPYIKIPEDEWQSILKDYEKDDIIITFTGVLTGFWKDTWTDVL